MKKCSKCGASCEESASFCQECGSPIAEETTVAEAVPAEDTFYEKSTVNNTMKPVIPPRNIVVALLLTFVTCGIYSIYWMIKLNDEINLLAEEPDATSGGMVFLFSLITCGIYGLYWMYKMGERVDKINNKEGYTGILYLVLSLFGLGIVSYCLMQDTINKAA